MNPLAPYLEPLPLVAVLRGITPEEIPGVGEALTEHGFRVLEVPLNSPRAFDSIRLLADRWGTQLPRRRGHRASPSTTSRACARPAGASS